MFFLEKYPTHKKKFEECLKLNSWNGFFVSALLNLGFNRDISVWTTIQNFFSQWRVTRYPKATSTPLELSKYANFTKPVFLSFSQSLNKFLDCGASLSRPVRFDLCPTNPSVTISFDSRHRWAMQVSRSDGLRCNFSANKLTMWMSYIYESLQF